MIEMFLCIVFPYPFPLRQRYGDGPDDQLPLESNGDYTREIGFLNFSDFSSNNSSSSDNLLNNVWYQPEEIFPVNGTPEVRQHAFWVPVDKHYFELAKALGVIIILIIQNLYMSLLLLHHVKYKYKIFKIYL